jgi:hypothetical protein
MSLTKGQRCRALRNITAHQGLVKAQTPGIVEFETDNLGRRLIKVQWDGSFAMYVFPDEIEMIDGAAEMIDGPADRDKRAA